ncbi:hypothetical protein EfmAA610_12250 [Enterococcus faecium]|nr:hypothetical protein EfmAA610_12250 [Enterococcus faecium]
MYMPTMRADDVVYASRLDELGYLGASIELVVFMQGCRMRCQFCHNPDTWNIGGGKEYTADELLDKAERFRPYWGDKGGITVSGGEPLLQIDFLNKVNDNQFTEKRTSL